MVTGIGAQHLLSYDGSVSYMVVRDEDVDWLEIPTFMGHLYWRWAFNENIDIERQLWGGGRGASTSRIVSRAWIQIRTLALGITKTLHSCDSRIDNPRNATGSNMSLDIFYQVVHLHVWGRCAILDAGPDNPRYATGPSIPLNIFHQLVHANVWRRYDKLDLFCLRLPAMLCWLHQLLKAITSTHNYRIVAASVSAVSRFNHLSCCKESPTSAVICATSGPLESALEWTSVIVVSGWQKNNTVWTRVWFLLTGSTVLGVHW